MGVSTEKRIKQLEDDIKALKATYSVYGGAMRLYLSNSPVYDAGDNVILAKIKFTPDWISEKNIFVSSIRCEVDDDSFLSSYGILDVQDGSGSVIIKIPVPGGKFSIGLVSTSPGTFTRIQ